MKILTHVAIVLAFVALGLVTCTLAHDGVVYYRQRAWKDLFAILIMVILMCLGSIIILMVWRTLW